MFFVITPNRNYGRFLGDAVAGVRGQDVDVHHHVQDACSTDGTREVIDSCGPGGLSFMSEPDGGLCDGLNRALGKVPADARYLGWLNADEFYLPRALAAVRREFERRPDIDIVYGDTVHVDEEGRVIRLVAQHPFSPLVLRSLRHLHIQTASAFFRSDLLTRGLLRLDPGFRQAMDHELFVRLADAGCRFGYLAQPLSAFRRHGGQLTVRHGSSVAAAEYARVAERFGYRPQPLRARARHRLLKVVGGAYMRELRTVGDRGRSMRWFAATGEDVQPTPRGAE